MEQSGFGAFKNEWIHHMTFDTNTEPRQDVAHYLEGFYSRSRIQAARRMHYQKGRK